MPLDVIDNPGFISEATRSYEAARAAEMLIGQIDPRNEHAMQFRNFFASAAMTDLRNDRATSGEATIMRHLQKTAAPFNAMAKAFRENGRQYQTVGPNGTRNWAQDCDALIKSNGALAKATLDVGTLTNFASITGGQSLGYVSLDTQMARGTVRPNSFSLYQALNKSAAFQVVDYWAYADSTGGAIPGAAVGSFSSVSSGTLTTNVGSYSLQNINLKLMLDARAMTVALASQNSFIDIPTNESTNAALSILSTVDWLVYWGNPTLFPNQFQGLYYSIPTANQFNFQTFYNTVGVAEGWSKAQALYNQIYEGAAQIASSYTFGRVTHAFMSPATNASLQGLVTTTLNNILNLDMSKNPNGIVVNGDLQGMRTRMGDIQFVLDLFIDYRNPPAQSMVNANGTTLASTTNPTPPSGVVTTNIAASAVTSTSYWTSAYTPSGNTYVYAVASLDVNSNESNLTYTPVVSGIATNGACSLVITPPTDTTAINYRIYRSGLGYAKTTSGNTPYSFRNIATVAASGSSTVTFVDYNAIIPGSEVVFLLDLAEEDNALDWRFLLPLTKIELFAQNLYMPWAVCMIGAVRNRIPKFHGFIYNVTIDSPNFNPLGPNN